MKDRRDSNALLEVIRQEMKAANEENKAEIREEIKVTVNGKIDKLHDKIDQIDIRLDAQDKVLVELKPYRDGLTAWAFFTGMFKGLAAVVTALGIIYGAFRLAVPQGTYVFQKTSDAELEKTVRRAVDGSLDNRNFEI